MQQYSQNNTQKYAIGRQIDIAIASGANATVATDFYSVQDFSPENTPEAIMIGDAEGNRSSNSYSVQGDRRYPFSFSGVCDVTKIGRFIYYATGSVVSTQDGATGAYKHVFKPINNVILPPFTIFFNLGAEGYRRLKDCKVSRLAVEVGDAEARFTIEGMGTGEDDVPNTTSTVATLTITGAAYQAGTGLIRYSFSGAPSLGSVKNGDVLNAIDTTVLTTINQGKFIIVSADNTAKTVDVINNNRTDATGDQSSISAPANTISIVTTPAYPTPSGILLRRHSAVKDATNQAGLDAAEENGLRSFSFEINNNMAEIFEKPKSSDPLVVIAKNIEISAEFTQIMSAKSAAKAILYRESTAIQRAWRFDLEDTTQLLGSSLTFRPRVYMDIPQAMGVAARAGMGSNDELTYDWTLSVSKEQSCEIVLQNTTASYS